MNATCVLICMYQQSMYWTFAIGGATLMRLLIFLLHAKKDRICQHHWPSEPLTSKCTHPMACCETEFMHKGMFCYFVHVQSKRKLSVFFLGIGLRYSHWTSGKIGVSPDIQLSGPPGIPNICLPARYHMYNVTTSMYMCAVTMCSSTVCVT